MASQTLANILDKAQSKDRDFRYMAASDLIGELQKEGFKADADSETKMCNVVLSLMEDTSGDISSLAVKCLGQAVHRVAEERLEGMLTKLCDKVVSSKKEQQRDTAAIGLKTVVAELPAGGPLAAMFVRNATPKLVAGVESGESYDVMDTSLDLLSETVGKFGGLITAEHAHIRDAVLPELQEGRAGLRKRALQCLAHLSAHMSDVLLEPTMDTLLACLQASDTKPEVARTYLATVAAVSRSVGYRFGRFLDRAIPLALAQCEGAGEDDELREVALQALESFVSRSAYEARRMALDSVLPLALRLVGHDPNYADYGGEEDMEEDEGEEEDDLSEEDYSDDEDMSWKVRRGAAKVVSAVVLAYPDALDAIYPAACPVLIERFREREENVKADVFATFIDLLHSVATAAKRCEGDSIMGPLGALQDDMAAIMGAATRQLKQKSLKTRAGVFALLKELVAVSPSAVAAHMKQLLPGITAALHDKTSSASHMKLTALAFLRLAMAANDATAFAPHAPDVAPAVFAAADERYYKVTAEALRVCEQLARVLRPDLGKPVGPDMKPLVVPLFGCFMPRLAANELDTEVKEAAMGCGGTAVARLADMMPAESQQVLSTLLERLGNEITRTAAVRALTSAAESPLRPPLGALLEPVLAELTSFLRKANRTIKHTSLRALEALVAAYGADTSAAALDAVVAEAAGQVSDVDLALAAHSLQLCRCCMEAQPGCSMGASERVLPAAMTLVQSPLLQGAVMDALQAFFLSLAPSVGAADLIGSLLQVGGSQGISKPAQASCAQCIAALATAGDGAQVPATVPGLLDTVTGGRDEAQQRLALLCIGKIGAAHDLAAFGGIEETVAACMKSASEDVGVAASSALGGLAAGNLQHFVPFLLARIGQQSGCPRSQYLLLKALSEVVQSLAARPGGGQALRDETQQQVVSLLFSDSNAEEECRNVVAECLGHLALLAPQRVLPQLRTNASAPAATMRQVAVTAMRFMVTDQPHAVDAELRSLLVEGLQLIGDPDRHVRRAALQSLSTAAHNKPSLVAEQLPRLLPLVYQQTQVDESLIRTVDLGPFKHKIDDGLELRKAGFEALDVLLERAPDRIDSGEYIKHLESGLKDHYDIKMPCHLMLSKLAATSPGAVLSALERLVEPLEKTLTAKLKSDAVKQEVDRNDDMIRSCLRAVESISRLPGADSCRPWKQLMDNVVCTGPLKEKFRRIQEERAEAEGAPDLMEL